MTPDQLIRNHREHLISRVVSRNILLRFRAPDKPTGNRLDICEILPDLDLFENNDDSVTPQRFLETLFTNGEVNTRISEDRNIAKRLRNLKVIAQDLERTTGQSPLILAWPFLHVPAEQVEKATKPLFTPLFLWHIKFVLGRNRVTFILEQDDDKSECELNFVAKEYLKRRSGINFLDESEILPILQNSTGANEKADTIKEWLGGGDATIQNLDSFDGKLTRYSTPESETLTLFPVAVIGNAYFNYLALFRELERLEEKAENGEDLGLLSKLFEANDEVEPVARINVVPENDRWLVEDSDPSQEKAVWLSNHDDAPIMHLEGPPGTGKSQTIVNIVAATLKRNEKVAVVCHHPAALNVVRKRLDGREGLPGLGGLVAQITSPKQNRTAVIQKARNIQDELVTRSNRSGICSAIEENEKICDQRIAAFAPNSPTDTYNTRGHFLAKIDACKINTDFDAHHPANKKFISVVDNFLQNSDGELKDLLEIVEDIAQKWEQHDYPNHCWHEMKPGWDTGNINALRAYFDGILQELGSLNASHLPSRNVLSYATHPIVTGHLAALTQSPRQNSIRCFVKVVKETRDAFLCAKVPLPAPHLWEILYRPDEARQRYKQYRNGINDISDICSINDALSNNDVIKVLRKKFFNIPGSWKEIVESAACKAGYEGLQTPCSINHWRQAKDKLTEKVRAKKKENSKSLISGYRDRTRICELLQRRELLRLRRSGRTPATTLNNLYHKAPDAIWKIFPVLLANPASVSQILPLELGSIDLVVVDEASQMFTADAMPLLYRAKRFVISGDQCQMPPSNFFGLNDEDTIGDIPEGADGINGETNAGIKSDISYELLEAVKNCGGMDSSMTCSLEVHYRSRPPELIDFSNHAFYRGILQAAPYNDTPPNFLGSRAIRVEEVGGEFATGKNEKEGDEIIDKLQQIWEFDSGLSVGVIVFNVTQRNLILDKADNKAKCDDNFRKLYEHSRSKVKDGEDEGFFVRSVEHVQGDERDIIILGTTYGSRRNYGPINTRLLGRRRLNVAVTRAKVGMIIVTSLNSTISNESEAPDGGDEDGNERWFLWKYMEYARAISNSEKQSRITEILQSVNRSVSKDFRKNLNDAEPANEFELQVGDFLCKNGLYVDYQVGESGFRIDIGIKNTRNDTTYLCGVECDGRIYHNGWRARQNDIWRQGILEEKGWRIERIWSDEWFSGDRGVRQKFLERVKGNAIPLQ